MTLLALFVPLGLVSDGDPFIQRAKVDALALTGCFAVVVLSDELGREHRKPDPLPFRCAVDALGVAPEDTVFVGDRPDKDVAGAGLVGMRTIRVRTGEYAEAPDEPRAWASVLSVAEAADLLLAELGYESASTSSRKSNSPGASR